MGQLHTELGKTSTLFHDAVPHVCLVSQHTIKYAFVAHTSFCQNCPIINPPDLPTRRRRTKETEVPPCSSRENRLQPSQPWGGGAWTRRKKTGWQVCLFSLQSMPPACALICPGWPTWERNTCHIKATVGAAATIQGTGRLAYDGSVGLQVSRSRNRRGKLGSIPGRGC